MTPASLTDIVSATADWTVSVERILAAELRDISLAISAAVTPLIEHRALVIFTEECTGRPRKKAGDPAIADRVTLVELEELRATLLTPEGEPDTRGRIVRAPLGGEMRTAYAVRAATNAVLVLIEPIESGTDPEAARELLARLWRLASWRIQERVSEAPPAYLVESRAASSERVRITAELNDRHSTALETILAALRSGSLDDAAARVAVTDLAVTELVRLRTESDKTISLVEEPVVSAFERLRHDLRPLVRFSGIDVQFVEPPADGRALPGEVAHAARAVVRGLVLAMVEQEGVARVRAQWDCDGHNLLINVRDDGQGTLGESGTNLGRVEQRVRALNGTISVSVIPGWGSDVSVALPLDAPTASGADAPEWNLGEREREALRLLAAGHPNRAIAEHMNISENTVKFHVRNVYRKLGVSSRTEALALALEHGLR